MNTMPKKYGLANYDEENEAFVDINSNALRVWTNGEITIQMEVDGKKHRVHLCLDTARDFLRALQGEIFTAQCIEDYNQDCMADFRERRMRESGELSGK